MDLDPIKKRLAAATPGPWSVSQPWGGYSEVIASQGVVFGLSAVDTVGNPDANAALIAHAPTDLAALVAEVERLRAALRGVAAGLNKYGMHEEAAGLLAMAEGRPHLTLG